MHGLTPLTINLLLIKVVPLYTNVPKKLRHLPTHAQIETQMKLLIICPSHLSHNLTALLEPIHIRHVYVYVNLIEVIITK